MNTNYTRIFIGNRIEALDIKSRLTAVLTDQGESALKVGFASSLLDEAEIYVHKNE